jgi:hypothetical protein
MGIFKHIGSKLKKARRIGEKVAHGVAIGLRKGGKALQKGAQIASKIQPVLQQASGIVPGAAQLNKLVGAGVKLADRAGKLSADVGRSGTQFLKDKDASSFLERSKEQKSQAKELFKN